MYKDVWPYWLARWILLLLFLLLFFCYKPIVLPKVEYVDRIKLKTVDNHLEQSLWIEVCSSKDDITKKYCTEEEKRLYWCDDNPECDGEFCEGKICWIYSIIISSWASLPASWSESFGLMSDYQNNALITVFQWEDILAQKNTLLQSWIIIDGLTSRNNWWKAWVNVTFNVDEKWYLSFIAEDLDNANNIEELTIKIPNNWYEVVPEGNISLFELIKWKLSRIFK